MKTLFIPPPARILSLTTLLLPLLFGLTGEAQAQGKPTVTLAAVGGTGNMSPPSGSGATSTSECREGNQGSGWSQQGSSNYWCRTTTADTRPTKQFRISTTSWPTGNLARVQAKVEVSIQGHLSIGVTTNERHNTQNNSPSQGMQCCRGGRTGIWLSRGETVTLTVRLSGADSNGSFTVKLLPNGLYATTDEPALALRRSASDNYTIGSPSSITINVQ